MLKISRRILDLLSREKRASLLICVCSLFLGASALVDPILFGKVVAALGSAEGPGAVIVFWAMVSLAAVAAGVLASVTADRMAHRQRLAVMTETFDKAITLPIARVAQRGGGRLLQIISAGGDSLFQILLSLLREQAPAVVALVLLAPVAFAINAVLALVLLALAIAYTVASILVVGLTEGRQRQVNEEAQRIYGRIGDVIANVSVVQAFARLRSESDSLKSLTNALLQAQYPILNWWALLVVMTRSASTLALVTIFAVGAVLATRGQATLGEIVTFGGFASLMINRLDILSGAVARTFAAAAALEALFNLRDEPASSQDEPDAVTLDKPRGEVTFEKVTHWIAGRTDLGVFDIDMIAPAGAVVALVGGSGAGKTTMMALLQRLRDPDLGRISIDGQDIRKISLESLRRSIAVVFQDAGLFNRSVADNLRIARPSATERQMLAALEAAEALDFVLDKPGGLEFVIGERGQLLSGGERQRLAIARAILKDAPILVLDEATSALDTVTERKVKTALDRASRGRTTFVIAHRLSTIVDADLILVLDKGRIVERGDFTSLMEMDGRFAALARESGISAPALVQAA